jgi:hypothetical protein
MEVADQVRKATPDDLPPAQQRAQPGVLRRPRPWWVATVDP